MKFSLVVATVGRTLELERLLRSLAGQVERSFEVIVVDQNADDRLGDLPVRWAGRLDVVHVRAEARGASAARNLGARLARGAVVSFPDDDCWYAPDVLRLAARLMEARHVAFVCGAATDPRGRFVVGRFTDRAVPVTTRNVWTTSIEFATFIRADAFVRAGGFDERLGPGADSPFQCHEIDDLLLRLLRLGMRGHYDPGLAVFHPDTDDADVDRRVARARRYAPGLGAVVRKNRLGGSVLLRFLLRSLGGVAVSLARGRLTDARVHAVTLRYRLRGWLTSRGLLNEHTDTASRR
ncbi:glycosyltransferase [Deinococcus pimensis]|uniref:glycosyltransferase n=1 Tax=Deinococcus pimensis TaxID=309888 RepID=UPI000480A83B|nr:glycosyltransferase [Deinococcus pimensis]